MVENITLIKPTNETVTEKIIWDFTVLDASKPTIFNKRLLMIDKQTEIGTNFVTELFYEDNGVFQAINDESAWGDVKKTIIEATRPGSAIDPAKIAFNAPLTTGYHTNMEAKGRQLAIKLSRIDEMKIVYKEFVDKNSAPVTPSVVTFNDLEVQTAAPAPAPMPQPAPIQPEVAPVPVAPVAPPIPAAPVIQQVTEAPVNLGPSVGITTPGIAPVPMPAVIPAASAPVAPVSPIQPEVAPAPVAPAAPIQPEVATAPVAPVASPTPVAQPVAPQVTEAPVNIGPTPVATLENTPPVNAGSQPAFDMPLFEKMSDDEVVQMNSPVANPSTSQNSSSIKDLLKELETENNRHNESINSIYKKYIDIL